MNYFFFFFLAAFFFVAMECLLEILLPRVPISDPHWGHTHDIEGDVLCCQWKNAEPRVSMAAKETLMRMQEKLGTVRAIGYAIAIAVIIVLLLLRLIARHH